MKSVLSKDFRYIPAIQTDLRKTFARIRRQLAEKKSNVQPMRKAAK